MQIKNFFQTLRKRLWIVLLATFAVLAATFYFSSNQPKVYQSKATYILSPRTGFDQIEDDFVRALEMVSRRVEINTTFAEVASSRYIKSQALAETDYSSEVSEALSVSASVLGGTNILEIVVEGPTPRTAQEFCILIGEQTQAYVKNLYDVFELRLLDFASFRRSPIKPIMGLNLLIGGMLGLGLGMSAAFVVEYIASPYSEPSTFNILDRETGAYNKTYFIHRLRQEMERAKRHNYSIAIGLIQIDVEGEGVTEIKKNDTMRLFNVMIGKEMRDYDIVASFDTQTFAFLYPHTSPENARIILNNYSKEFESMVDEVISSNGQIYLGIRSTVVTYKGTELTETELIDRGIRALKKKQLVYPAANV
jgi:capsular polysaccharide biosynthesis protein